jgi:hypothetical protein
MSESLLFKFKPKDTSFGVTRQTLKALAQTLGVSETMAVHTALARFAREVLPAYEKDDGPLTPAELASVQSAANAQLPTGQHISYKSLF